MSKKIYLTSDGYSYHTLELRYNPTDKAYRDCFERLQQCSKAQELYPQKDPDGRIYAWRCNAFSQSGIQIFMTQGHQNLVALTINPRKLLDPASSYLGIVPPYQDTLEEIRDQFTKLMRKAGLPEDLDEWKLHRLDLCVNICWNRKGAAAELIRLMRVEDLTPSGFEKSTTGQRHEVRYSNGQLELVAYDKLLQMTREGLLKKERLPKSVLRVELRCGRAWLREFSQKKNRRTTTELIETLGKSSRELIITYAGKCMYGGMYRKLKEQLDVVESADGMKKKVRKRLKDILKEAGDFSLRHARHGLTDEQWKTCMNHFERLGIHPVPLRRKYPVKKLPSLLMILKTLDDEWDTAEICKDGSLKPCIF